VKPLLEVAALTAGYGGAVVLRMLTMTAGQFGNVGLFGPNGHGKTTLLRAISGLVQAKSGSIRFAGQAVPQPHDRRMPRARRAFRPSASA
jgi:branched-chain amino acid transport system ATP-binding protein